MRIGGQIYSQGMQMAMLRMSTAERINSAADDAAGLAISEKMRSQANGEGVATRNMRDSQSMYQVAEGGMSQTQDILQRMREIAVQANSGILTDTDRQFLQQEFSQLREGLNDIGRNTEFNTKRLLDGSLENFQTTLDANGSVASANIDSTLSSQIGDKTSGLTLDDIDLVTNPSGALDVLDGALQQISSSRSNTGSLYNRLSSSINVSITKQLNTVAAESRIRDTNYAEESMNLQRANLLQQTYFSLQKFQQNQAGQILSIIR